MVQSIVGKPKPLAPLPPSPKIKYGGVNITPPQPVQMSQLGTSPASISQAVQEATNAANSANSQRYGQGLGVLSGGYNAALAADKNASAAAYNTAGHEYQRDLGQQSQSAINRGIGNTTILNSLQDQAKRRYSDARLSIGSAAALRQEGLLTGGANNISGYIAGRNDVAPDLGQYASLIQSAAAGNNGAGPAKQTATITKGSINDPIMLGTNNFSSQGGYTGSISDSGAIGGGGGGGSSAGGSAGYYKMGGGGAAPSISSAAPSTGGGYAFFGNGGYVAPPNGAIAPSNMGTNPSSGQPPQGKLTCRPYNYIFDSGLTPNAQGQICS